MALTCKAFGDIITFTRASSATFTGSNGLIQSATTNTPRFDYDPVTLAAKGLLIEEQRTNLLTYSEQFDNAAWVLFQSGTVTPNAGVAPDGSNTADLLTWGTGSASGIYQSAASAFISSMSLYAKTVSGSPAIFIGDDTGLRGGSFNLSTGALVSSTGTSSTSITPVGNGWYRIAIVFATAPTAIKFICGTGVVGSALIWGAQLEAGAFATSYIPTVASQATRSADVASVNTLSPWYNATEGTLYAEGSGLSSDGNRLASLDPGPSNLMYVALSQISVVTGGVSQAIFNYSPVANTTYKQALAYKTNDFAAARDGTVATDTSGSVPSVSKLSIGNIDSASLFVGSGYIRRITYYPRRLSNAELQAITA